MGRGPEGEDGSHAAFGGESRRAGEQKSRGAGVARRVPSATRPSQPFGFRGFDDDFFAGAFFAEGAFLFAAVFRASVLPDSRR